MVMGIEYTNRCGEKYFLLQGKTKTGKPKYYVSRKAEGVTVEQMPDGYEFYENPERGLVSVRKIRPSNVSAEERQFLEERTRILAGIEYFCVDIQYDSLVIYTPATDPAVSVSLLSKMFGGFPGGEQAERDWIGSHTRYLPMLRFTLTDEHKRLFTVERWCFRGGIDGWHFLARAKPLAQQAETYLPHLNQESFFELM